MFLSFCILSFAFITCSSSISGKEYARLPPVFEFDNFDRCLLFEDDALYCYVEFHLKPINSDKPSETWNHIRDLSVDRKNYRHDILRHGICIPHSCPNISMKHEHSGFKTKLEECMNRRYEHSGIYGTIEHIDCQTEQAPKLDLLDILVAFLIFIYILFVLYASCYEGLARYKTIEEYEEATSSRYGKILCCFSIPKSWDKLKMIDWNPDNTKFRGIQGIRFYNMFLVILTHAAIISTAGPISNTRFTETLYKKYITVFILSGPYGVSTFFQISALLLTYNIWKQYDEKSRKELNIKTVLWIVLYRYIRLTPAMAFILIFHSTILNHTGRGPMWNEYLGIDRKNCRNNGWINLLYMSNWIKPSEMCLIETWYLMVDMQAFVLVLVILYFTIKRPRHFLIVLIVGWILNHLYVAWHLYRKSLFHFLRPYPENVFIARALYEDDGVWVNTLPFTPMNLASTFVGAGLGFLIYKIEKLPTLNTKTSFLIWTFGIYGVALAIVGLPGLWLFSDEYYDSHWFSIPYLTLGPTIYCLALASGIFLLISGHGWATKWILEWSPMYYLGRISYSTYLTHYPLVFYSLASLKNLNSVSSFSILLDTGKILVMSSVFGLILSLLVEYPISALSSLLIKGKLITADQKSNVKCKSM